MDTWERYGRYLATPPEMTLEWRDAPTGARGWLVVNSLRGGAAGGGTRMRVGLNPEEVTYLAKAMELKFSFSGPHIGGAKSGIAFDPTDPRKEEVLRRWFRAIRPLLREVYGTGGDVNVDEQREVHTLCDEMGLAHPQEGIVRGHLGANPEELARANASLRLGLATPVTHPELAVRGTECRVADLITGYGVARAAARLVAGADARRPDCLDGLRVVVEGFGNVGGPAALYLARMGARVVGITDARAGLAVDGGLGAGEIEELLARRGLRDLPPHPARVEGAAREAVYGAAADLFVPAAVSGTLDQSRLDQLKEAGVGYLVCGANQPMREIGLGDSRTLRWADERFRIVPDVVGSLGMARAFHFLMTEGPAEHAEVVFSAVRATMEDTVAEILQIHGDARTGLVSTALELSLNRIGFAT